ncbi:MULTISPECIES: VCBS repeat-containing protein [unclassified Streptomyces]|uniref:FG-GAP repeat domain-containing protein n=1 Tax=unclassified Streptomyces TaxID=2593676 RepID=UPI0006F79482|nr:MULTISPECIES: VCBS repeat-containing protein [unclassified Streptomyces]KQX59281.1 hypothetical protein ASD33_03020 [Streptomyces sp. Root1304]KRB00542.1 hypothetical protein ASE09_03020 [Streptomyces sp. Root66D1]
MRISPSSRRLTAAVTAVLAVTLGAGALAAPAVAAPTAAVAGTVTTADTPIPLPDTSSVLSAGPSGFLSAGPAPDSPLYDQIYRWTSTVDGTTRVLPTLGVYYGGFSDVVVTKEPNGSAYRLYDMSQPGLEYQSFTPSGASTLQAVAGSTLVMSSWNDTASTGELRLVTRGSEAASNRLVTGLPDNARILRAEATSATGALVHYTARDAESVVHHYLAVVDTTSASVVEKRAIGTMVHSADSAQSASHLAWVETMNTSATLHYAERDGEGAGPAGTPIPLGTGTSTRLAFAGRWLTYAVPNADWATAPNPLFALTALDPATGVKATLLDAAYSSVAAPDGSILVRGGTVAQGEGVYRITDTGGATPTVTMVASTGRPTALTLLDTQVPAVVDFDKADSTATLRWQLSRQLVSGTVKLRHVRTGRTVLEQTFDSPLQGASGTGTLQVTWDDRSGWQHAPNGDYVWELDATPKNGIGPALKATGTFKVVRKANAHDFNDNGSPDLLALDASGVLWRYDVFHGRMSQGIDSAGPVKVGAGFQAYNQIEAAGNLAGGAAGDFVARDSAGVLWSFLGKGDGTFTARTKVGPGWGAYNKIAAGSDLTGDGRPDLVAVDGAGALWLHKATGKWDAPYAARVKVAAGGFNTYNQITAVGDYAGGTAGDLVARDTTGVLWSFLGNGRGGFAPRTKIGGGWNAYTQLVGAGDIDKDGHPELVAYGREPQVYMGTGLWSAPLGQKSYGQLFYGEGTKFRNVA